MPVGSVGARHPLPVADLPIKHSGVTHVQLSWSNGQGVRPAPGMPVHPRGLYLTGDVRTGHFLQIDKVSRNTSKKTITITVDARGPGAPRAGKQPEQKFVGGAVDMKAEKWTVVVKDGEGHEIARREMMLGGPPAA